MSLTLVLLSTHPLVLAEFSELQRLSGLFLPHNSLSCPAPSPFSPPGRTALVPLASSPVICFLELSTPYCPFTRTLVCGWPSSFLKMIAEVWEGSRAEAYTRDTLYGSLAIGVSCDVAKLREQGSRYCPYSCCRAPCPLLPDTWGSPSPEPSLRTPLTIVSFPVPLRRRKTVTSFLRGPRPPPPSSPWAVCT